MKYRSAVTFMELITYMLVIGILAAIAIPRYTDYRRATLRNVELANVGAVRAGLKLYFLESVTSGRAPVYPARLDAASNNFVSPANAFFTVLMNPPALINGKWRKLRDDLYGAPSGAFYFYDSAVGTFEGSDVVDDSLLSRIGLRREDITATLIDSLYTNNTIDRRVAPVVGDVALVGGSVVIENYSGSEGRLVGTDTGAQTFSFASNESAPTAQVTGGYGGYFRGGRVTFGYYVINPDGSYGQNQPIFIQPNVTLGQTAATTIPPNANVGFYMLANGNTFYSQTTRNSGNNPDHSRTYTNDTLRKVTVAWEDLPGGGDQDFQDFMVTISY